MEQNKACIYGNKRIWKGRTIWVRYSMWCPSHQVHPLAEQARRKMDVSPCTLIYCYSVLCHSEGTAQLILLPISTLIFWKHLQNPILFHYLYVGFIWVWFICIFLAVWLVECINVSALLPMRSRRSMATVSKARLIMGYSSSTSLKWSTDRE